MPKRPTSNKGWKDLGSELSVAREDIVVLWRAKIQTTPSQKRTKDEVEKRRGKNIRRVKELCNLCVM